MIATTANDRQRPPTTAPTDKLARKTGCLRYGVSHPGGTPISNEVTVSL